MCIRDRLDTLKSRVAAGLPVLGTCAGLILLAQNVEEGVPAAGDPNGPVSAGATAPGAIGTLPVTVRRNAYGLSLIHILIAESPAMVMLNPATVPLCFRIAYLPMVDDVPLLSLIHI